MSSLGAGNDRGDVVDWLEYDGDESWKRRGALLARDGRFWRIDVPGASSSRLICVN